jgi:prevent-host-death family protein
MVLGDVARAARIDQLDQPHAIAVRSRGMAKILNLYEAKSRLSSLVEEAAAGEEVIIAKAGVPRARLVAVKSRVRRRPGGSKGRVRIAADFDAPLPATILTAFTGRKR